MSRDNLLFLAFNNARPSKTHFNQVERQFLQVAVIFGLHFGHSINRGIRPFQAITEIIRIALAVEKCLNFSNMSITVNVLSM